VSRVTVDPDGVEVALLDGETILAGLYRSGYAYRTGCRRGGCGICKVDLVSGDVD
jgi:ferredoxin